MIKQTLRTMVDDTAWLDNQAERWVASARREHNGFTYYTPGGGYEELFTRDFAYLAEGTPDLVGVPRLKAIIQFILKYQRAERILSQMDLLFIVKWRRVGC